MNKRFLKPIIAVLVTLVFYWLAAQAGLKLATINEQVSPVWPATGIAIVCIYLFGFESALGVLVGATLSNFSTHIGFWPSACIGIGNTLEAIAAVILFRRLFNRPNSMGQHSRLVFSLLALFIAAMISASFGTLTLISVGIVKYADALGNWITWWVGDSLGALFLAPFAYKIVAKEFKPFDMPAKKIPVLFLTLLAVVALNLYVFTRSGSGFFFIVFVPLLFVARQFDGSWIYIVSLIICFQSVLSTVSGHGPFVGGSVNDSLIRLQLFLASLGITAIGLGTLRAEGLAKRTCVALLSGWLLCGVAFYSFFHLGQEKDHSFFTYKIKESQEMVEDLLYDNVTIMNSAVSYLEAADKITEEQWKTFTKRMLAEKSAAGLHGLGVVYKSNTVDVVKFLKQANVRGSMPGFKIHPVTHVPQEFQVQDPVYHFVVTYLEPKQINRGAIGLDLASEKIRYEAAMRAARTGQPAMSQPIQLVQDSKTRPGFLIFVPFYERNWPVATEEQRLKALRGFVHAPYLADEIFGTALASTEEEVKVKVYVGENVDEKNLVYHSKTLSALSNEYRTNHAVLEGLHLTFVWGLGKKFDSTSSLIAAWIGLSGALCSLFFAIMVSTLEGLTRRAQKMADEMNHELEQRRRLWQTMAEVSPAGIFLTDEKGQCTYVNPTWSKITGLTPQESLGTGWTQFVHPEDSSRVSEEWKNIYNHHKFSSSFRFKRKNGEDIFVVSLAVPVKNESGEITGYVGTIQDITELQHKQDALVFSSRMSSLGEMASGIAHEINNPLTIILGKARKIESLIKAEKAQPAIILEQSQQIARTVHRISKIIKGLQAFARDTTSEPFQQSSVDDLIQNTIELCQERFTKHTTELRLLKSGSLPSFFWGREEQVSQVLMNLLNNAFDAVQVLDRKWVHIEVKCTGEKVQIGVIDSGQGISAEIESKIFNPFFTTKEIGKGTGLGLSISKGIMEKHRGRLFLDRTSFYTKFVIELDLYTGRVRKVG